MKIFKCIKSHVNFFFSTFPFPLPGVNLYKFDWSDYCLTCRHCWILVEIIRKEPLPLDQPFPWNQALFCFPGDIWQNLETSLVVTITGSVMIKGDPLDGKEIQLVHPKGNQSWTFIGKTDAEAETPILWPSDAKNWLIGKDPDAGKDWRQEEKGTTEDELVGWHYQLDGREFEQASLIVQLVKNLPAV